MVQFLLKRPILVIVIIIIIFLLGIVSIFNMAIEQYPNISPPSIRISLQYPGADAKTAARTVAIPLENKLNGIDNLAYMNSTSSSNGSISIRLTFNVGTNLNSTINEVLNRINAATSLLPSVVNRIGINVKKSAPDQLLVISFFADPKIDPHYMANYLYRTIYNDLSRINGVGEISMMGTNNYAFRIWLNLKLINHYKITITDIIKAIKNQNNEIALGKITNQQINFSTIILSGLKMYSTIKEFKQIIIQQNQTQIIRLGDVATIELGNENYNVAVKLYTPNGLYNTTALQINSDGVSDQLSLRNQLISKLQQTSLNFPAGIHYLISFDATDFINTALKNIFRALRDSFFLVSLVIFLFLANWRASLIAIITIPISIIGSFSILYLCGYSINTITLFALILAIGIVVDDAIVILENIIRLKQTYPQLTLVRIIHLSIHEIAAAIIAITLVLSVVFIPLLFLGGISGVLYQQFGITLAATMVISAIVSLLITPTLSLYCLNQQISTSMQNFSWLLKIKNKFNQGFNFLKNFYLSGAAWLIDHCSIAIILFLISIVGAITLFKTIPRAFIPNEDLGYFFVSLNLANGSSLNQTEQQANFISKKIINNHVIKNINAIIGIDLLGGNGQKTSAATLIVQLVPWQERSLEVEQIIAQINHFQYKNITLRAFNIPPLRGLNTTSGLEFYLENRIDNDSTQLYQNANLLIKQLTNDPMVKKAYFVLDPNVNQVLITPQVDKAKYYNIALTDIYSTIQAIYSSYNVNYGFLMQDLAWVIISGQYSARKDLAQLKNIYLRNNFNQLIPLNNLINTNLIKAPDLIEHFNGYTATKVIVEANSSYSLVQLMDLIKNKIKMLANGYNYEWVGTSYQQIQSQDSGLKAIGFSLIMIYLVLCALYGKWLLPLIVLMGMPFALGGALLALWISNKPDDLYFQISLLALLGLSAKNMILLIEFANHQLKNGINPKDSILYALNIRLKPIIMTSTTFIAGVLTLLFASGAGANANHSVATGIIGGVLASTLLTTMIIPSFFVLFYRKVK